MSADATRLAVRPFRLEMFDENRANPVDASDGVIEFVAFTNIGSLGEVSGASLRLDARHGWLLTQGRPALRPTTPGRSDHEPNARGRRLDQFALCRLTIGRGSSTYSRYLEVRDMKPDFSDRGLAVSVEFACLERNLKDVTIPGHWWFHTYREVIDAIISHYNSQKGTAQPTLSLDPNTDVDLDFPTGIPVNFYSGTDCYTAIEQLIDRLRQPVQAYGIGDYVSAYYTDGADHTSVVLHIVRQGSRGDSVPVLVSTNPRDVSEITRTRLPSAATRTIVRGAAGAGTMPMHLARAVSAREEYLNALEWHGSRSFVAGAIVAHGDHTTQSPGGIVRHYSLKRWRAKRDIAAGSPAPSEGADWEEVEEWAHLRPHIAGWKAFMHGGPTAGGMWGTDSTRTFNADRNSVSYPDSNLVIRDLGYWQDWVHYRVTSAHPLQKGAVEGTRALVVGTAPTTFPDGTSTGLSAGQVTTEAEANEVGDLHGNADNSLIEVGQDGAWFVKRRFPNTATNTSYTVAVIQEGRIYEWNRSGALAATSSEWYPQGYYGPGELVTRTATAADVAAVPSLVAGTSYVYRNIVSDYRRIYTSDGSGFLPPPQDASRWALVGAYDDLAADERPSGGTRPGDWVERRNRAGGSFRWDDVSAQGFTPNHCFHYPLAVDTVPSLHRRPDGVPTSQSGEADTAIRTIYRWGINSFTRNMTDDEADRAPGIMASLVASSIGAGPLQLIHNALGIESTVVRDTATVIRGIPDFFYRAAQGLVATKNLGWWTTLFEAPMPDDGSIYRPPVLDLNNRNMTPSGNMGWGAPDAEDLGRITGLRFTMRFDKRVTIGPGTGGIETAGFRIPFRGNVPFRCWVLDTEGAVWHQDFAYRLLGTEQIVELDFSNFSRLHSRAPADTGNIFINTILPEIRNVEGFNTRKIKLIGLHLLDNYDEHGRYWPWFNPWNNLFEFTGRAILNNVDNIGTIDAFAFIKSPIAVVNQAPDADNSAPSARTIAAPLTEMTNISNYVQLKGAAEGLAELNAWRLDNFHLVVPGRADLRAEQSVILKDGRLVTEEDATGDPNTLRLTVTRVSHSVTADHRGWVTDVDLYRRVRRNG